ncbi:MAG: hypothetical protein JJT89_06185 [Nitriliruptoraceae bacterium]|nr:hypothetical protein [Nitriliruptoraceae bacterium]
MPKSQLIDPEDVRRPGAITTPPIAVNAYDRSLDAERERLGDDVLRTMLADMLLIREFETMLDDIKRTGAYQGIEYQHRGPAHLSIGQEAAAVGQALHLGIDDVILGSHRSHGEIIAKGRTAIARAEEPWLERMMEDYFEGEILRVVEKQLEATDTRERATQFLLYGLLAEVFGRRTGFNRGMGGSMHAFFPPLGIFPNNAIVGGSAGIAAGVGLGKKIRREPGLVVANLGDGSTGCGPVWEALNLSAMGQFDRLWDESRRGGLPLVFFFVNNFYAMGGQTIGETMAYERLARIGAGLRHDNLNAETVDGNDPVAVADAMARAQATIEERRGPVLLDVQCYRQSGHSPSDASTYREREEMAKWSHIDPIATFGAQLIEHGVIDEAGRDELAEWARRHLVEVTGLAADLELSPRLNAVADPDSVARLMFSDEQIDLDAAPPGEVRCTAAETDRGASLARRSRSGLVDGQPVSPAKAIQLRDALFEAIAHHVVHDDRLVLYGEENRDWDGAFGVYRGLTQMLPYHRLFNSPISEAAIVASGVGLALAGGRALIELMYADFIGRAGDEIFNQLAKWQSMSGGVLRMPVVLRVSVGSKYGAQHSQDWTGLVAHIPGLKVVYPATPYDAKGLMASALSSNDPVVFFESQRLYDRTETLRPEGVPEEYYRIPIGSPAHVRHGEDLTILSVGATLETALATADRLSEEFGIETDVIDARTLVPFDHGPVIESVRRTGRIVLTSDASERGSFLATLAADLQSMAFDHLDAPVTVVGARNWITPPAELEDSFFPSVAWLCDAIHEHIVPLPGYTPTTDRSVERRIDEVRRGV